MDFFGSPDVDKLAAEHDLDGLYRCLEHNNPAIRLRAAEALADINDLAGWQFLFDAVRNESDLDSQIIAGDILGEMGQPRAIPFLEEALKKATGDLADNLKEALQNIGGREADEALRRAGFEPVLPHMEGAAITDYEARYVRPVMPDTSTVEFLTAEQHLNLAVELREAEHTERALVEDSLALWLAPEWAYAWYLRGVLFEDLDRSFEAALCYRWALELDSNQAEAQTALGELESENTFLAIEPGPLMEALMSSDWQSRRDAAAGLGELGQDAIDADAVDALIKQLNNDEDREVRHAVIEALGNLEDPRAMIPLIEHEETSWMLRFSIIEALAQLRTAEGLVNVLGREMNNLQERNPVFSSRKDPMLEVEYERLMEVGVLALERTGDIAALLAMAEDNALVEEDSETEDEELSDVNPVDIDAVEFEDLADEDETEELDLFVDEVALMVSLALEKLASAHMSELPMEILSRLAEVPDLILIDVSSEEFYEPADALEVEDLDAQAELEPDEEYDEDEAVEPDQEPVLIHDLTGLRESARLELLRR